MALAAAIASSLLLVDLSKEDDGDPLSPWLLLLLLLLLVLVLVLVLLLPPPLLAPKLFPGGVGELSKKRCNIL